MYELLELLVGVCNSMWTVTHMLDLAEKASQGAPLHHSHHMIVKAFENN